MQVLSLPPAFRAEFRKRRKDAGLKRRLRQAVVGKTPSGRLTRGLVGAAGLALASNALSRSPVLKSLKAKGLATARSAFPAVHEWIGKNPVQSKIYSGVAIGGAVGLGTLANQRYGISRAEAVARERLGLKPRSRRKRG
jgi:hypothetical protein